MKLHKLYKDLFRLKTRYCIVTGGRGSGKSFAITTALLMRTFEPNKTILFTRYTMTSAEISIIPEFWEKVELMGLEEIFERTMNSITNKQTGSTILFRGLKASSGKQTANLKSINNITTWVLDEAEEMHDEDMFDKIDLSVRKKGVNNEVILVLNPSNKRHMIYRKFFKERGVYEVCNQVKDDCTYVHTTYLNNLKHLDASFLEIAEKAKIDEDRYNNIFLGNWSQGVAGLVFKNWKIGAFPTNQSNWYGIDWGYSCFSGETLIETDKGSKSIREMRIGDMVLTRSGYKRVLRVFNNGYKPVIEKEIRVGLDNKRFICTFNHNFNANGKWKKYGELTTRDNLFVLLNLTGRYTEDTPQENTQTIITTKGRKTESILPKCFITQFTNSIAERYQRAKLFITLMATPSIMILVIWLLSLFLNTLKHITILAKLIVRLLRKIGESTGIGKIIGKKGGTRYLKGLKMNQRLARIAERNLQQQMCIKDSVIVNATIDGNILPKKIISWVSAKYAAMNLRKINTLNKRLAALNVHISSQPITEVKTIRQNFIREVFDLEIEGKHEYFANGVLVHNCDPTAIVRVAYDKGKVFVKEICYQKEMHNHQIAQKIKNDFQNKRTQITDDVYIENGKIYTKEGSFALETTFNDVLIDKPISIIRDVLTEVYCDPSRPEHIAELRKFYGISALGAINADKVGRIEFLKGFEIIVSEDSKNLIEELSTYQWLPSKEDSKELQNKVQDGNDHGIDSLLYSAVSHLRRMGVVNNLGEV